MTDIFSYDTLPWPEVAALPRDTPLVLPLGAVTHCPNWAQPLGRPPRLGMLPAILRLARQCLAVPTPLLQAYVTNLLDSSARMVLSRLCPDSTGSSARPGGAPGYAAQTAHSPSATLLPPDGDCGRSSSSLSVIRNSMDTTCLSPQIP